MNVITDHDPGDEHADKKPWPFYSSAAPFEMPTNDDLTILWAGKMDGSCIVDTNPDCGAYRANDGNWYTAVAGVNRENGRFAVQYADGRVEDITELVRAVSDEIIR